MKNPAIMSIVTTHSIPSISSSINPNIRTDTKTSTDSDKIFIAFSNLFA